MKWIKLLVNYLANTITIFYLFISQSSQKNIYHAIDGAKWESSLYINEAHFNKSKYFQSEKTIFQNLSFLAKNYTVPIESMAPYQDISYKIFEVDSKGTLNDLRNITLREFNSETNIFYDKYKIPYSSYSLINNSIEELKKNENSSKIITKNIFKNTDKYFLENKKDKENSNSIHNFADSSTKVECKVNFTGLSFDRATDKINENSLYDSVINYFSINFVTYKNTAGVHLEKYLNGNIANKTEIINFITNKYFTDFSKIKISKIIPSFLYQRHYLFLLDEQNSNIYLLRINSEQEILKQFNSQINGLTIDVLFAFKKEQIEKFEFKNLLGAYLIQEQKNVYFVTQTALFVVYYTDQVTNILTIDSFKDPDTLKEVKFNVIGAAFDKDGCYIALKNYGLVGFNTREEKLAVIYRHPKIHRIDSFYFEDKNIGLFLNNLNYPDESIKTVETQEFLIELNKPNYIFKGNYTVNKVFFSDIKTNRADYYSEGVLDLGSSRGFILERKLNKVFLIARNLPFQINNIDSFFSLPEELKNKDYNYFNLVSVFEGNSKPGKTFLQGVLLLQTNDQIQYRFFRFDFNTKSNFICIIEQSGTYWFNHQFYTYDDKQLIHYALDNKIYILEPYEEVQDQTFSLIMIIIFAIAAIFGVYFGLKKCRETRVIDSYTNVNG